MTWQPAATIFPDAELVACQVLRDRLAERPEPYAADPFVGHKVPAQRRDRMVIVRRDGGARIDHARETARFGINVWATSDQEAGDLARLVRALLWAAPTGDPFVRIDDLAGPMPIADDTGQPRVYFTCEAVLRSSPLDA